MPHREILKGKRILAVDDELDVLETVREQLTDCEVTTARTFQDAEQLIHSSDIRFGDIGYYGGGRLYSA